MMGTEFLRRRVKEENIEIPSIPPGFESLTSFSLKRVEDSEVTTACSVSARVSESHTAQIGSGFECSEDERIKKSLRRRPWINYGRLDSSSGDESDSEQNLPSRARLPKGVVRGCEECSNCQKVIARWHPEEARTPDLQDAPVFYPDEKEFEDTLKYIESIRDRAEAYGVCRIVPPPSWKPPCPLKEKTIWETSKFATRIQRVDKLQNRDSVRKLLKTNTHKKRKRRRCLKAGVDHGAHRADNLGPVEAGIYDAGFGFEPGPKFTLEAFQKYADDFKAQYFRKNGNSADAGQDQWEPSVENIEGEYWRMVENPNEEIEVLYGADLETGEFGSGFPKLSRQFTSDSDEKYVKSGWNLNNFPRLPGSVLSYESSDISGVLVPWLYIGMCFSSFCWHVEDHHLYSMNYMHWGAPKIWYGVPGKDALKLEAAMRKHLPDLFEEQPDLLHKLVTQLSPSILKSEGVPVFRCIQNPREFVLTFPRAYHSGFNCGFNCAEAVNVAPVDWLPHGQNAIELYREQGRKTSISHDKLLLGAARDAVKAHWELNLLRKNTANNLRWKDVCGKDGILSKALKARVEMERVRRAFLCNSSQSLKMESSFDATNERECSVCFFDLHLSAAGCHYCSPDRYACLNHSKHFCSCSWGAKFFLFRYDMNDLSILVDALEGKLSAIYRWAKLDLGLALSSYVAKENLHSPGLIGKLSYSLGVDGRTCLLQKEKPPRELMASKVTKESSTSHNTLHEAEATKFGSQCKKTELLYSASSDMTPEKPEVKKPTFFVGNDDVILLSDDEGEEPSTPLSERVKDNSSKHTGDSEMLADSTDEVTPHMCIKDPVLTTSMSNAAVVADMEPTSVGDGEINQHTSSSECIKGESHRTEETLGSHPENLSCHGAFSSSTDPDKKSEVLSSIRETGDCNMENAGKTVQQPQPWGGGKPNNEERNKVTRSDSNSRLTENVQTAPGSPSCTQNNLDRYFRQKGPRIAKVVRRINCNVEPLEYGVVHSGKLWCDSRAIYPKGFKSRVRYISVLDPTDMCYYVSEILDAGRDSPLFMVSLENCPSEVFIQISAVRCWEMIRERVNHEITKQHKLGRLKLPPLQPPGSLDGMEMFGFTSPAILQVIQAMDRHRYSTEYWETRPFHSQSQDNGGNTSPKTHVPNDQDSSKDNQLTPGVNTVLCGLFNKANPEELNTFLSIFSKGNLTSDQDLVIRLVNEEILKCPR